MSDADILAQIDAAILTVATKIAAGIPVVEYTLGGVRVKKESPSELLKTLKQMRSEFVQASDTDRSAGICTFGGAE